MYGKGIKVFIDRDEEIRTFESLSKKSQGPNLLGQFANGRVKEFIHARVCRFLYFVLQVSIIVVLKVIYWIYVASLIAEAIKKIGPDGVICVESFSSAAGRSIPQVVTDRDQPSDAPEEPSDYNFDATD
ncbi:putative choline kinase 2 [Capsicum baccatum]|uniref:Choline kinase 2 n=1 Tax=Capsicum baccatum TaxID=33114 RepID=A0A2G2WDQ7_CAPBA|nr:putative choline kinase 2 [Capsicum baccatum]